VPIYEYRRPDGTTFEVLQSMSEDALTEDPETGVPVTKVMHAPSIHFKGSGFYNTDYGKKTKGAAKGDSSSNGDSSSSSDTKSSEKKSESKSDSKSESKSSSSDSKPSKSD
jgi:putative FmdB family regulatory protein